MVRIIGSGKRVSRKVQDKQVYWIVFGMVALIVFVLVLSFMRNGEAKFEYKTLSFTIEKPNNVTVYHYYHYFTKNNQTYQANTYLRIDPRENNVSINASIIYPAGKTVYYSLGDNSLSSCDNSSLALGELSQFFAVHFIKIKGATYNKTEAQKNNISYVSCDTNPDNPVIMIQAGETSMIKETKDNCYVMEIANCEILSAVEKFEVQSLLDAKSYLN